MRRTRGYLRTLPDGETGERSNWVVHIIEGLRSHPDLELDREGDWSDYGHTPRLKVRQGHTLLGASLDFGHVAAFEQTFPLFQRLRAEQNRQDLTFQVGIPGDLDMGIFSLGPVGGLRHRRAFTEATAREIREIHARGGDDVLVQLEVPAELVFVARAPRRLQAVVAAPLARGIVRLVQAAPEGVRFGVHLCLGDLQHQALGRMRDLSPLVALAGALARRWPAGRPLEYVHTPLAAGAEPPPRNASFYDPLTRLRLPEGARFIAGFVHEGCTPDQQRRILSLVEDRLGHQVDVATACGLGRRAREPAMATMQQAADLCET